MDQLLPRTETEIQPAADADTPLRISGWRRLLPVILSLCAGLILLWVGLSYRSLSHDAPLLEDSTLGELAVWVTDQAAEEEPPSLLASWAKPWLTSDEDSNLSLMLNFMQSVVLIWCSAGAVLLAIGIVGVLTQMTWSRAALLLGLVALVALLFQIPVMDGDRTVPLILLGITLMLVALLFAPGPVSNVVGFVVVISVILVGWQVSKSLAASINYQITLPQQSWNHVTYSSLEDALDALVSGETVAVIADENDFEDIMPPYPGTVSDDQTFDYPDLHYLSRIQQQEQVGIFPVKPALTGRLSIALRAEDAAQITRPSQLLNGSVGAVEGDFAVENYLAVPRQLVLVDLQILNDLNLPPLQSIAEAFLQPARRNGEFLLTRILGEAGLYTWREALFGFVIGTVLGLLLGTGFAHSRLMERALLPYVVASQTVPILAIAPMVVIWLGASFTSVAVIAAYITFFPVTINTLRGLRSPNPTAVELMDSYAATWWTKLWKLRFPAALPYIFAALKVSATASVVGAIIGELPSGIGDGLGRAILDFSSDYSLVSTPKLWAAIVTAAIVGVIFFVVVSLIERAVLRRYVRGFV
jgi:NitT/TauT family transport system permease protein